MNVSQVEANYKIRSELLATRQGHQFVRERYFMMHATVKEYHLKFFPLIGQGSIKR